MYLYIVSCPYYVSSHTYKLGCTGQPYGRLSTYLTGWPPNFPQCELQFYAIWEVTANDLEELKYYEKCLHDHEEFKYFRLQNSEWFQFPEVYFEKIDDYLMSCEYFVKKLELADVPKPQRSILKINKYSKNTKQFIVKKGKRNELFDAVQAPIIEIFMSFINSDEKAAQYNAPCGSGKTKITCEVVRNLKRVIICVPSIRIQKQWKDEIDRPDCILLGGKYNTVNLNTNSYCVITTYRSCKKLIDDLPDNNDIIVFDEAHHMAGYVSDNNEKGEGITRALLDTIANRNMKRLFLTFTPKDAFVEDENTKVFSMNDERIFGKVIADLKLRDLIIKGILPDYRIWPLSSQGTGMLGKLEQVLSAWNSGEINHLMIFVRLIDDKKEVKRYLEEKNIDCPVYVMDDDKNAIEDFKKHKRAIIVDCFMLGEGVDIPIADSVAILYPKGSVTSIVQTVLRPGRWFPYKSVFHILLPHTADEDMGGIHSVLLSLAQYDDALRGEVLLTSKTKTEDNDTPQTSEVGNISDNIVQYDVLSSTDVEKMKECFKNISISLIPKTNKKVIQKLCFEKGIKTSKEYEELRKELNHLPEDPRFSGVTWFDFLNPDTIKISLQEFINKVIENNLRLPSEYTNWSNQNNYINLQNIRDGYFGEEKINFIELVEKYAPIERRRR